MKKLIKKTLNKILKILIEIFPKTDKVLCSIDYYQEKRIIKKNDNIYIFSKYLLEKNEKICYFEKKIKIFYLFNILTSKVILHKTYPIHTFFLNNKQINIVLGYFTPFKADRYLEKMCLRKGGKDFLKNIEECNEKLKEGKLRYITCSKFASNIIAKSNNISLKNFIEIGMTRNAIRGITKNEFRKIFSISKEVIINKIILFTPTFRDKFTDNLEEFGLNGDNNIFGYENIVKEISKILEDNNIYIVIKLHKFYQYYEEKERKILLGEIPLPKNCLVFSSEIENNYNIGIYNLFDVSDAMIADYSSISFDYLLKDKPVFYNIFDIDEYREYRGFSYEPIEELMAGELIRNKSEFLSILEKFGKDYKDKYKEKRQKVNLLVNGIEKQENVNEKIYSFIREFKKNG